MLYRNKTFKQPVALFIYFILFVRSAGKYNLKVGHILYQNLKYVIYFVKSLILREL